MVSAYINFIENIFRNVNLTQANLYESLTVIFLSCFHVFFFSPLFPFSHPFPFSHTVEYVAMVQSPKQA